MTVQRTNAGRKPGSRNNVKELPESIHPEQRLTIAQMAALSGKSESYFYTNLSLARTGKKHSPLPPVVKLGRHVLSRAADFFAWLEGGDQAAA